MGHGYDKVLVNQGSCLLQRKEEVTMSWKVDQAHTLVEFSVKHMMISTVRGRFHNFSGTLNLDEEYPERSSIEGVVEVASLDTHEPNRDAHLRSADFFDVEKYPTMKFRSTRIEKTGDNRFDVVGDLTIKNVTREITFNVTSEGQGKDPYGSRHWGFSAETTINRKDFGLNWNVALETGGWLVGDLIKVNVDLEAVQQVEEPEKAKAVA
jgi:polyisoprenoid-binding protein YceI